MLLTTICNRIIRIDIGQRKTFTLEDEPSDVGLTNLRKNLDQDRRPKPGYTKLTLRGKKLIVEILEEPPLS